MRRRRKVGRAYDMALEIARVVKPGATILDVGCGNGFIAHHLTGLLKSRLIGLDMNNFTSANIDYVPYDGRHFPVRDRSVDAVLLCYVLHHARDASLVLNEVRRVLRKDGRVIVYEDSPSGWWDRAVCWSHNKQWEGRTGPCTFQLESEWQGIFALSGFKVESRRRLSRWRNIAHPVSRNFFVLEPDTRDVKKDPTLRNELTPVPLQRQVRAGT
ncbi:MAG TPA: class I SAM-dependent methyltransferase [Pyrinomonadaceae bacterium]